MELCLGHEQALLHAINLRGLTRLPSLDPAAFDPLEHARAAIHTHATNFAGKAALEMCTGTMPSGDPWCPICFINRRNPARLTFDDWVEHAAQEALEESRARQRPQVVP